VKRGGPLHRRTPLRRRGEDPALGLAREAVRRRAQGRCEARLPAVCDGWGTDAHHVRSRAQGGAHEPENLLWLCGAFGCHGFIHAHPAAARCLGLLGDPKSAAVVRVAWQRGDPVPCAWRDPARGCTSPLPEQVRLCEVALEGDSG
jgi:hypothetical protein